MDNETKKRIADYYDAWELVEFLQLSTEDIIDRFEEEIEEALDDIEELMEFKRSHE